MKFEIGIPEIRNVEFEILQVLEELGLSIRVPFTITPFGRTRVTVFAFNRSQVSFYCYKWNWISMETFIYVTFH